MKRILVDMSATIFHHGHVRLLKEAKKHGNVIVALTTDIEVKKKKGYLPELNFSERKEILLSIRYVDEVLPSKWIINEEFLISNNIDFLVHGIDNSNPISKEKLILVPRTPGISSSKIREKAKIIIENNLNYKKTFK
tara:strand:+ start:2969 stop:3379 length:411 start_codon:yes stop_codon:yes gene_type:complete